MVNKRVYIAKDEDFKFVKDNDGYEVEGKGKGCFQYIGKEKIIEVPDKIQGHKITSYYRMFEDTEIEEVISTNKDIVDISCMFRGVKTNKLTLYSFDTSNVVNMTALFSKSNIDKLDLGYLDTAKVRDMTWMFYASNIKKLSLYSLDTSNVVEMSGMFWCSNTELLDLSSFDTSNVVSMYSMFNSSAATEIVLSGSFDIARGTDVKFMFKESKITNLDLSSINISNILDVSNMFIKSNLKTVSVRTQEDIALLSSSIINKPDSLVFVVK